MKTYGLILAGGRSRRFAGKNKAWLEWQGRPLIQHAISSIQSQVDDVIISANQDVARCRQLGFPVITDTRGDHEGPLMGIYSAMEHLDSIHKNDTHAVRLLSVPCDIPLLPADLMHILEQEGTAPEKLHVAHDGDRLQPLVCLIPLTWKQHLRSYIDSGKHRADHWIQSTGPIIIDCSAYASCFRNINQPGDLEALNHLAAGSDQEQTS